MDPLAAPIRMNGLRLSKRLIHLRQSLTGRTRNPGTLIYRLLAEQEINIEFLNLALSVQNPHVACCVEAEESARINAILNQRPRDIDIASDFDFSTLSLYPHKHSLHVLGKILEIFGKENHSFFQMASSGAMLTFVVNFRDQEKIAASLVREIDLPKTHTPFRQIIDADDILPSLNKKPETSATYNESNIRTYGILKKSGLSLYRLITDQAGLASAGKRICRLSDAGTKFDFVSAFSGPEDQIYITIIAGKSDGKQAMLLPDDSTVNGVQFSHTHPIRPIPEVDLIYFQGPHFGDRHGIADRAFSALLQNNVNIICAGCVGASIYIGIDAKTGVKVKNILGVSFNDPLKIQASLKKRGPD